MKELRIECKSEFFEELESFLFCQTFGETPNIDSIRVVLDNGEVYDYEFEYSFGSWYIVTI